MSFNFKLDIKKTMACSLVIQESLHMIQFEIHIQINE